ncbi:Major facilitator superfamily domain-containing protein 12 [Gossypium australe]|uniref:Major facilitator superfamily domain-containing protein 12 n=1 Tax=Gossypium australe TaxID=47621 RepID=A0A5B6VR00_9ROSI|nr:Major facilitator superfamily domain-containing protein 12 [Gossypium australe]
MHRVRKLRLAIFSMYAIRFTISNGFPVLQSPTTSQQSPKPSSPPIKSLLIDLLDNGFISNSWMGMGAVSSTGLKQKLKGRGYHKACSLLSLPYVLNVMSCGLVLQLAKEHSKLCLFLDSLFIIQRFGLIRNYILCTFSRGSCQLLLTVMSNSIEDDSFSKPVGRWSVYCYGVGHMLNDITSACWFTYLLLFLTEMGLSSRDAAIVMLSGQIADGLATIFFGELIDRFGHFKIWHGAGAILVAVSFSSVFGGCIPCKLLSSFSTIVETVSYSTFAAIFNVGWAATQVSHMSMVSCITLNSTSRVVLASCRNAFTMVANLSLYGIAFIVFEVIRAETRADIENQYRWIAYLSIFIGCCFVGVFHLGTKEPRSKTGIHGNIHARISWTYWFLKILYYQVAIVYMLTRLVLNVSQAYLAFYVIDDLQMAQSSKALVPAIIYICSFVVSILLQEIAWNEQRLKAYYTAGGILWIFCGIAIILLPQSMSLFVYAISIFIGMANALMTVTAVSMQNVLIGQDLNGCAFVCGSLSFLDKISCGLTLFVLQSFHSSSPIVAGNYSAGNFSITRYGLGLVPAFCSLVGVAVTWTMELRIPLYKPLTETLLE